MSRFAAAGGMGLLEAPDLRLAAAEGRPGLQEVEWGLFPISGSTVRFPIQISYVVAMENRPAGGRIDTRRAFESGRVNRVVPKQKVLESALQLAEKIVGSGPIAVREVRHLVRSALGRQQEDALARELGIGRAVLATRDAREGPRAFEKRKPRCEGR